GYLRMVYGGGMSGDATFSGTNYQAAVMAYVAVHILAQRRLQWLYPDDVTPTAISGETEGPGDDARIEFGGKRPAVELQAKHGCRRPALVETVQRSHKKGGTGAAESVLL